MIIYNFVIIDSNGYANPYLNFLDEDEFLEELWRWCYVYDLWDYIKDNPEVLRNKEELEDYLLDNFIPENLFYHYEEDDSNCFAFTASDEKLDVKEYDEDNALSFVLNKIKERNG